MVGESGMMSLHEMPKTMKHAKILRYRTDNSPVEMRGRHDAAGTHT
jgi:hypothetical protein